MDVVEFAILVRNADEKKARGWISGLPPGLPVRCVRARSAGMLCAHRPPFVHCGVECGCGAQEEELPALPVPWLRQRGDDLQ